MILLLIFFLFSVIRLMCVMRSILSVTLFLNMPVFNIGTTINLYECTDSLFVIKNIHGLMLLALNLSLMIGKHNFIFFTN